MSGSRPMTMRWGRRAALWLAAMAPGVAACEAPTPAPAPAEQAAEAPTVDMILSKIAFSWVIPNQLAGLAHPDRAGRAEALRALADQSVTTLVSLTETPIPEADLKAAGLRGAHFPVVDFTAPTHAQLEAFVRLAEQAEADGEAVAVHCAGGRGRTGTFLAAWYVAHGMPADDAIATIRAARPHSIETPEQEAILRSFAYRTAPKP